MILDYLEIALPLSKDNVNFTYLERTAYYHSSDISQYQLRGNWSPMKIVVNPRKDEIILKGSIPFYYSGQNFSHSNQDFQNALDVISNKTNLNWLNGSVRTFEAGVIIESAYKPDEIIHSHLSIEGMETNPWKHGRVFSNSTLDVKLYNAKHRTNKVCSLELKKVMESKYGYNAKSNYTKFENKYKKPSNHFLLQISTSDLCREPMQTLIKEDILLVYNSIKKSHCLQLPDKASAGEMSSAMIKDLCFISGMDPDQYTKQFMKSHSVKQSLNTTDRKNRNRTLKTWANKIQGSNESQYDLSKLIAEKLDSSS